MVCDQDMFFYIYSRFILSVRVILWYSSIGVVFHILKVPTLLVNGWLSVQVFIQYRIKEKKHAIDLFRFLRIVYDHVGGNIKKKHMSVLFEFEKINKN